MSLPEPPVAALAPADAPRPGGAGIGSRFSALIGKPAFWVIFVVLAFAVPIGRAVLIRLPPMLPVVAPFPEFHLINEQGRPFGSDELKGRVWVATVLSTKSPDSDALAQVMRKIQHRAHALGADFHVVCFTGDPDNDTPQVLAEFLRGRHASPRLWSLLTGTQDELSPLLRTFGAGLPAAHTGPGAQSWGAPTPPILLIDTEMRVRARYDSTDPNAAERVLRDLGLLANRGG